MTKLEELKAAEGAATAAADSAYGARAEADAAAAYRTELNRKQST